MRLIWLACCLALPASAATVSLTYDAPAACPSQPVFRQLVAARLGLDPFVEGGTAQVSVRITGAYQAEVVLVVVDASSRRRTLNDSDCDELARQVAVTVALAVDPLVKPTVVETPKPTPPEPTPEPSPEPKPVPPLPPVVKWRVEAGAHVVAGLAVGAQPALRLGGRVLGTLWSLGLEGRYSVPVKGALTTGELTTSMLSGSIVPCLHWRWLAGCADLSLGGLRLEGSALAGARAATVFHASAGLRAMASWSVLDWLMLGALIEGNVPFTRASAVIGSERVWTVWPVGFGAGVWIGFLL